MRKNFTLLTLLLLFCLQSNFSFATIYTSTQSGNWSQTQTWGGAGIPDSAQDTVLIGHSVTLDDLMGNITIAQLKVTNAIGVGESAKLIMAEEVVLTVQYDVEAISEDYDWNHTTIKLTNSSKLNARNLTIFRTADNTAFASLELKLFNNSQVTLSGELTFDYKNSTGFGFLNEIHLDNSAHLVVAGNTYFYARGGNDFDMNLLGNSTAIFSGNLFMTHEGGDSLSVTVGGGAELVITGNVVLENSGGEGKTKLVSGPDGGSIMIGGNVELISTEADLIVEMNALGDSAEIQVLGNIKLSAKSENDVSITLSDGGELLIGGDFERVDNNGQFGSLHTSYGGELTYNGTTKQTIACNDIPGSGTDEFNATKVNFNNPAGFLLDGPIIVYDSMTLESGIITTDSVRTLTIADGAMIKGGSETAFIAGPITKQGSTNGVSFIFPTGFVSADGSMVRYAPIEITALSNPADQFTAEYTGCPPPYINAVVKPSLDHISSQEYWTLTQGPGTLTEVNITLHWMDSKESGIDDTASLVVASLDTLNRRWESLGNGGGITTNGLSGTVQMDTGCPPPYINRFTFGSSLPSTNSLPVDLVRFTAQKVSDEVKIEWLTASETDNDFFVVERSKDGVNFEKIGTLDARGDGQSIQYYTLMDQNPNLGQNYYRLMQMDLDGMYNFSNIISVNWNTVIGDPIIYPNPVADRLNVRGINPLDTEAELEIYDLKGQLVYNGSVDLQNGNFEVNAYRVNLLTHGNYFLRINSDSGIYTLPLYKATN